MAHSAHKSTQQKKQFFDSKEQLELKIQQLAQWIKESSFFIAFTGAGISTAAGIPDFRSGKDTVLKTGPGAWEKKALNLKTDKKHVHVSSLQAIPTPTHMMLVKLMEEGILKGLISQNTDGLHRKSGIIVEKFAELHGNTNLEKCKKCKNQYMRDFRVRTSSKTHKHQTGRKCDNPKCRGDLLDTIINFGQNLPERDMNLGFQFSGKSDVCIAMGSSLRVTPAALMPQEVAVKKNKLIIVNLQKTPMDQIAALKINAECDKVSKLLMAKLGIEIPDFKLRRFVKFTKTPKKQQILVEGVDKNGTPYSIFPSVDLKLISDSPSGKSQLMKSSKEPFRFSVPGKLTKKVQITLNFKGNYGQKHLSIILPDMSKFTSQIFALVYDIKKKQWNQPKPYIVGAEEKKVKHVNIEQDSKQIQSDIVEKVSEKEQKQQKIEQKQDLQKDQKDDSSQKEKEST